MIEPLQTFETLPGLLAVGRDDAVALAEPGGASLTYAALRASVDAVARGLRARGIARGATVALAMPNGLGVVVAFLGIARAGCVAAPLNPAYTQDEFHVLSRGHRPGARSRAARSGAARSRCGGGAAHPGRRRARRGRRIGVRRRSRRRRAAR